MIEIAGLLNNKCNGNYKFTKMVNHRPMYQSFNGLYAIWFSGQLSNPNWMIGRSVHPDTGKFTTGYAASHRDARCPDFRDASTEWTSTRKLTSSNTNIAVTCIGKTIFK